MGILTHVWKEDQFLCKSKCVFLRGKGAEEVSNLLIVVLLICERLQELVIPQHSKITFRIKMCEREELESWSMRREGVNRGKLNLAAMASATWASRWVADFVTRALICPFSAHSPCCQGDATRVLADATPCLWAIVPPHIWITYHQREMWVPENVCMSHWDLSC